MLASHWLKGLFTAATIVVAAAAPANAQEALDLKPGKAWKHKHSGITVPATLADTPRTGGNAYAADDLDVSLSFTIGGNAELLSFYIFRNTNGAVPVWFSQAQWAVENRDVYGHPALSLAPQPFVPPGQTTGSGLKAIYEPKSGAYRSTGVMLLPVGEWYVKIRASSQSRSPTELANWMNAALAEVKWPKVIVEAPESVPVTACPSLLSFPKAAQDAPKTPGQGVAEALGVTLTGQDGKRILQPKSVTSWCRDADLDGNKRIYRPDAATDRYLFALGDNGNAVLVGSPETWGLLPRSDRKITHSIQFVDATATTLYVPQDILPSPERVADIINADRVVAKVSTWGESTKIEIVREPK